MRSRALSAAAAIALAGCREHATPPAPATPTPLPAPQATPQRTDTSCEAPLDLPSARVKLRAPSGQVRIGVLAGLKDADDENLAVLKKLVAELKRRGAEV